MRTRCSRPMPSCERGTAPAWSAGRSARRAGRSRSSSASTPPTTGHIFDDMVVADGGAVELDSLIQPMVEPELAFILDRDVSGPGVTRHDVLDATTHDHPVPGGHRQPDRRLADRVRRHGCGQRQQRALHLRRGGSVCRAGAGGGRGRHVEERQRHRTGYRRGRARPSRGGGRVACATPSVSSAAACAPASTSCPDPS